MYTKIILIFLFNFPLWSMHQESGYDFLINLINGYSSRLAEVNSHIKTMHLSPQTINALALACIAFDSKYTSSLVWSNELRLERTKLQNSKIGREFLDLFDYIHHAKIHIKNNSNLALLSKHEFMNWLLSGQPNYIAQQLERAALEMNRIFDAFINR